MRLIDADELLKHKTDHEMISTHLIYNMPTIDAEPVRRGRWLEGTCFECSECKAHAAFAIFSKGDGKENVALELLSNYCPNCGAKMEGE